ncbi:MAG: ACP S-malonyltransferase [Thermodesulfobacteriota bacterium]
MIAFVFPGQGSQSIGMGLEFYNQFPVARLLFEEASDTLNFNLAKLCFEGEMEELSLTANAQPALLTVSIAAYNVLNQETDITPDFVAGHSLGEYSALVVSGALEFKDAVYTVRKRGEFMQDAVPVGLGSMAAVIGLSKKEIEDICDKVTTEENIVCPANYNSPQQIVISGNIDAVETATDMLKDAGAKRVVPLTVSAPFHCSLMKKAADELSGVLNDIKVTKIGIPIVTNVEAIANNDESRVRELLFEQVVKPVRWFESVEYLTNQNVNTFIEIGPGNVLSGLIKRTVSEVNIKNLEKPVQLNHINENGNGT